MIEVVITKDVSSKVVQKYTSLYRQMRRKTGSAYPRAKLIENIRSALSCSGEFIDEMDLRKPIIPRWDAANFKVYHYRHWYYAVKLMLNVKGDMIAVTQDALYEGDYHNDTMETKPYEGVQNRKVVLSEARLRAIIKNAIRRVLYN